MNAQMHECKKARRLPCIGAFLHSCITSLLLELHHRYPAASLFGWREGHSDDERVLPQKFRERALQLASAVAVDQPEDALLAEQRLVQKPLGPCQRFVDRAAHHVQLGRVAPSRLKVDVDTHAASGGSGRTDDA